jgi:Transposase
MSEPPVWVGMDVSTAPRDVALRLTDEGWHVSNDESGSAGLVERLRTVQPTLVVREATGGLAGPATGALAKAGLPVVVVPPRHARDVANAPGRVAKTDSLAARGAGPRVECPAEATAPVGAEAHGRPAPSADGAPAAPGGPPGPPHLADAPLGPQRCDRGGSDPRPPAGARPRREAPEPAGRRPHPRADAGRRGPGVGGLEPPGERRADGGRPLEPRSRHRAWHTGGLGRPGAPIPSSRRSMSDCGRLGKHRRWHSPPVCASG